MMCIFVKTQHQWICKTCGRKVPYKDKNNEHIQPSAKCRIPDKYIINQKDIYYKSKKIYPGVGSCLLSLLEKLDIHYDSLSDARAKARYLDKEGIEWCENNQITILEWIKEESKNRNLIYNPKFAKILLRLAIKQSKHHRSLLIY